MITLINSNTNIDNLIEEMLSQYPMASICYEVIGNELYWEVVPHEVMHA